jgi:trans-aconitate methyltransferase
MGEATSTREHHWETVYETRPVTEVSWYQSEPTVSLELIDLLGIGPGTAVVDIGGGASVLADELVARGFEDITVVDIAQAALDQTRTRLGSAATRVHLLQRDLLDWAPEPRYGLWHDRAVFHFLVEEQDRKRYLEVMGSALAPGAAVVMGTFGPDGPEQCSGLPVARHSVDDLATFFEDDLELVAHRREEHVTPSGAVQVFSWVALRRPVA